MARKPRNQPPDLAGPTTVGFGAEDALSVLGRARVVAAAQPPRATLPLDATPPARTADEVYAAVYWRTKDLMAVGRTAGLVAQAVASAQKIADAAWGAQRPAVEARAKAFDCAKGCSWCCHQQVALSPGETLAIVRYLETNLTPETRARILDRVRRTDDKTRGMPAIKRRETQLPCPLLEDGACGVHPARPMRCRGFFSRDVGLCRFTFDHPVTGVDDPRWQQNDVLPREPTRLFDAALRGLATALHEAGLESETLELAAAVRVAVDRPDAIEAWIHGEPGFAEARLPPRPPGGGERRKG
jgi:Fe-S-cluster containining protein